MLRHFFDAHFQLGSATASSAPRMLVEIGARRITRTNPFALASGFVDLPDDGLPDKALRWVGGSRRFATNAEHSADGATHGRLIFPKKYDRGRAGAGDVGARGVEDVREVPAREVFHDEVLAKLALHEGIRRNLPDESGQCVFRSSRREENRSAKKVRHNAVELGEKSGCAIFTHYSEVPLFQYVAETVRWQAQTSCFGFRWSLVTSAATRGTFDREVEQALHEGHGERILAVARGIARVVELADGNGKTAQLLQSASHPLRLHRQNQERTLPRRVAELLLQTARVRHVRRNFHTRLQSLDRGEARRQGTTRLVREQTLRLRLMGARAVGEMGTPFQIDAQRFKQAIQFGMSGKRFGLRIAGGDPLLDFFRGPGRTGSSIVSKMRSHSLSISSRLSNRSA